MCMTRGIRLFFILGYRKRTRPIIAFQRRLLVVDPLPDPASSKAVDARPHRQRAVGPRLGVSELLRRALSLDPLCVLLVCVIRHYFLLYVQQRTSPLSN